MEGHQHSELKAGRLEVQVHHQIYNKVEASLGYLIKLNKSRKSNSVETLVWVKCLRSQLTYLQQDWELLFLQICCRCRKDGQWRLPASGRHLRWDAETRNSPWKPHKETHILNCARVVPRESLPVLGYILRIILVYNLPKWSVKPKTRNLKEPGAMDT